MSAICHKRIPKKRERQYFIILYSVLFLCTFITGTVSEAERTGPACVCCWYIWRMRAGREREENFLLRWGVNTAFGKLDNKTICKRFWKGFYSFARNLSHIKMRCCRRNSHNSFRPPYMKVMKFMFTPQRVCDTRSVPAL